MNPITFIYTEALFRPILNLMVGITNHIPGHNIGWAIIIVTIIIRLILLPASLHQVKKTQENQAKMGEVQGRLKAIKEKHKDDSAKQAEETMKVYKESGVNPVSGCLPLLIQLPVLIALYRVFLSGLNPDTFSLLYSFVGHPDAVGVAFFGLNLTSPSLRLGILAGIGQFIQMKFMSPTPQPSATEGGDDASAMMSAMQKNMMYIFPAMTVFIALQLPAALALYWLVSTVFGIGQQFYFKKVFKVGTSMPVM